VILPEIATRISRRNRYAFDVEAKADLGFYQLSQSVTIARHPWRVREWATRDCRGEVVAYHESLKAAVASLKQGLEDECMSAIWAEVEARDLEFERLTAAYV
jgi:hypothetical protein